MKKLLFILFTLISVAGLSQSETLKYLRNYGESSVYRYPLPKTGIDLTDTIATFSKLQFKRSALPDATATTSIVQYITSTDSLFLGSDLTEGMLSSNKPIARFSFAGSGLFSSAANTAFTLTGSQGATLSVKNFNGSNILTVNSNATNAPLVTSTDAMTNTTHNSWDLKSDAASNTVNGSALRVLLTGTDGGAYGGADLQGINATFVLQGTGTVTSGKVFSSNILYGKNANNNPATIERT